MPNTPGNLAPVAQQSLNDIPFNTASYISARLLAASTAESITIPANAKYVRLAGTDNFYYSFSGAATVPGDTDDGSACELIKQQGSAEWRVIPPGATAISVISAGTPIVTASFYTL